MPAAAPQHLPLASSANFPQAARAWLALVGLAAAWTSGAAGQSEQGFEQGPASWQLRETDCELPATAWTHERTPAEKHAGLSSEHFRFQTGHGSKILVAHSVDPSHLIPELQPEVWLKANRGGIRLAARVVIPPAANRGGQGPVKIMIDGPRYDHIGNWQRLSFGTGADSVEQRARDQLWTLSSKTGAALDIDKAYVDLIVLNLYTGPGACDVWIDDLRMGGAVTAETASPDAAATGSIEDAYAVRLVAQQEGDPEATSWVRFDGNIIELGGQPFFARAVLHNGEPLDFLKELGFNVVELRGPPTLEQLMAAQSLDLWLVAPPPASAGLQPIGLEFDRVLAWSVGRNLSGRDLDHAIQTAKEIRYSDPRKGRPILADVRSNWSDYGQTVNIVATGCDPLGGGFRLSEYGQWLAQRQRLAGPSVPIWAAIPTELPSEVVTQIAALSGRVPPTPFAPQQVEAAVFEALAGGARGLRFLSRTRLDATDPVTLLRAQTIRWLNVRVSQFEPWGAGGAVAGPVAQADPNLKVTALRTERARLLLIQRVTGLEQWTAGDAPLSKVSFVDVGASATDRAYWLAPSGMIPLPLSTIHGGAQIELEHCPSLAAVVVADSPVVVNRVSSAYRTLAGQSLSQLRTDLIRNWLAIVQLVDRQMSQLGQVDPAASAAINEAITLLQRSETMLASGNELTADECADQCEQRLASARRQFLSQARGPFHSAAASALLIHPLLVPQHWGLANHLSQANWFPNALAGGDFENLPHLVQNGWINRRSEEDDIETLVELTPSAAVGGRLGLSLTAKSNRAGLEVVESAPVWITSGDIPVRGGQIVRVHGWAKLAAPLQGSREGLTIIDSLGGASLAERITEVGQWQEFSLYRGVPADGRFNVTFALTGLGTAQVDEVTVRIADPAQLPPESVPQESANATSGVQR
jgi:hypothetical protein